jgi:hypothetical protein
MMAFPSVPPTETLVAVHVTTGIAHKHRQAHRKTTCKTSNHARTPSVAPLASQELPEAKQIPEQVPRTQVPIPQVTEETVRAKEDDCAPTQKELEMLVLRETHCFYFLGMSKSESEALEAMEREDREHRQQLNPEEYEEIVRPKQDDCVPTEVQQNPQQIPCVQAPIPQASAPTEETVQAKQDVCVQTQQELEQLILQETHCFYFLGMSKSESEDLERMAREHRERHQHLTPEEYEEHTRKEFEERNREVLEIRERVDRESRERQANAKKSLTREERVRNEVASIVHQREERQREEHQKALLEQERSRKALEDRNREQFEHQERDELARKENKQLERKEAEDHERRVREPRPQQEHTEHESIKLPKTEKNMQETVNPRMDGERVVLSSPDHIRSLSEFTPDNRRLTRRIQERKV